MQIFVVCIILSLTLWSPSTPWLLDMQKDHTTCTKVWKVPFFAGILQGCVSSDLLLNQSSALVLCMSCSVEPDDCWQSHKLVFLRLWSCFESSSICDSLSCLWAACSFIRGSPEGSRKLFAVGAPGDCSSFHIDSLALRLIYKGY